MLIKDIDDRTGELAALEALAGSGHGSEAKKAKESLRIRRAGLKGEQESAYQINFYYETSRNWAVIHDLRIEHNGRTAQIDHLLLNRALECYVLESKHFHAGVKITDEGEFLRWDNYSKNYVGMPSPLAQNARHVEVLRDVLKSMDLPTRLGVRLMPKIFPLCSDFARRHGLTVRPSSIAVQLSRLTR